MKTKPVSQSAFFNPRALIAIICLIGGLATFFALYAFPGASVRAQGLNAQSVDENSFVRLNAGTINTTTPEAQALRSVSSGRSGNQMRLIQFAGPIRPEWYQALVATGARIVTYIPSNSYLVYGNAGVLRAVQLLAADRSMAQWDGEYTAAYRLDPGVTNGGKPEAASNLSPEGNEQFVIQLVEDPAENAATLALIEQSKLEPIISQDAALGYLNVKVALPRDAVIHQIAERGDVVSIQQWVTPVMMCERQDQIMAGNLTGNAPTPGDYLAYLTGKGFNLSTTAGFGVNVSDTGLDNGTTTPNMFLLYRLGDSTLAADTRVTYVSLTGTAVAGDLLGCNGHGNLNCTIIGGYVPTGTIGGVNFGAFPHADASGFRWGLGIAPFVKVGLSVFFKTTGAFVNPNYETVESNAYAAGMRISSNSWGAAVGGAYNADSQRYDALVRDAQSGTAGNQEYTIAFSAGNSGSGANTTGAPGTGKNVITVGAGEDVNPFGGADGSGVPDSGADSANDIIGFSSRGPCDDQRVKPEIMGPGTHVSGGAPQNAPNPGRTGNGNILACFTGNGVSGGVAPNKFHPAGQTWYTASSGTSHSCPAIAGTVALYRQYFIDHALTPPSPALNKALLMNAARYMTGVGAAGTLPSNSQGMGEASLNNFFDIFASAHILHDELASDLFTATGQQRVITTTVADNSKPLRVTLAWTDVPGPTSGNAFVNNLDLTVTAGGNTFLGNVFTGAFSVTGGTADIRNNSESVFIPAGVTGPVVITVKATNIAGDGVPGNGQPLDQDYALVVYNASEGPPPTPTPTPTISPGITPTPPPTPTPTPTPTATPTPTVTPTPTPCSQFTFSNTAPIPLPDCPVGCAAPQPAGLYPSNITVAGVTGSVLKVTVAIAGWTHTFPGDMDMLLVGPGGQKFIILSDALTTADVTGQTYTLDDGAAALMPSAPATAPASGPFRPTNYTTGDTFPAPAPVAPYLSPATAGTDTLAAFNGVNPNGMWSLYIVDDANVDTGTIAGGWSLSISTNGGCATPTPTSTPTPTPTTTPTPTATPTPTLTPPTTTPTPTPPASTPTPTLSPGLTPTPTPPISTPTPSPSSTPGAQAVNLSTRMNVRTGDNVGIGGFIIQGTAPKHVLLRAIGPSITGLPGVLADPVLELHGPAGFTTVINNNWQDDPAQAALIQASGLAPTNTLESAIDKTLPPGAYTGVVKGNGNTTGIGLVEVYDLSQAVLSKLANISTRALVGTGNDIVIAGFILGNNSGQTRIVVRGIGGSLTAFGVPNALANPTLELRDNNAAILASNDNWQSDPAQAAELTAAGLAPTNPSESGIAITLGPGQYTALLSGVGNTTGVGVVEVYDRGAP